MRLWAPAVPSTLFMSTEGVSLLLWSALFAVRSPSVMCGCTFPSSLGPICIFEDALRGLRACCAYELSNGELHPCQVANEVTNHTYHHVEPLRIVCSRQYTSRSAWRLHSCAEVPVAIWSSNMTPMT